ncbi:MAG: hypothetical protein M3Z24_02245 [Chloroflexota bacterium]|nr:hypothetical protein [Chloroflexota bacterium]
MVERSNDYAGPVTATILELRSRTSHWTSVMNAATTHPLLRTAHHVATSLFKKYRVSAK